MIDIGGRPLLGRVIDRAKQVVGIDRIVVATSTEQSDDVIADFVRSERVGCYRGELDNVAGRAAAACDAFGLDAFVRICGDRPFFDPDISELVRIFEEFRLDMSTTTGETKLPPGLTGEIVRASTLKRALPGFSAYDREHVTAHFYTHSDQFSIKAVSRPHYVSTATSVRLVVDDEKDLARARAIASGLSTADVGQAEMFKIISLAEQWDREQEGLKENSPS